MEHYRVQRVKGQRLNGNGYQGLSSNVLDGAATIKATESNLPQYGVKNSKADANGVLRSAYELYPGE
ncbi:MAG: hypothetical protein ACM3ZQ_08295 [Bacillota bacterium]